MGNLIAQIVLAYISEICGAFCAGLVDCGQVMTL